MNRRQFLRTSLPLSAPLLAARASRVEAQAPAPAPGADGWIPLFNGRNLDGWYTFLQRSGRGVAEKSGYVSVENGLLHIMGRDVPGETAESGYLSTLAEFENVRIRVEYKWGVKRFAPRLENKRDNGLLYYVVGDDRVWPRCIECQIQETDTGDVFFLGGTRGIRDPETRRWVSLGSYRPCRVGRRRRSQKPAGVLQGALRRRSPAREHPGCRYRETAFARNSVARGLRHSGRRRYQSGRRRQIARLPQIRGPARLRGERRESSQGTSRPLP